VRLVKIADQIVDGAVGRIGRDRVVIGVGGG